jgi:mRNA interferase RelE/StbE
VQYLNSTRKQLRRLDPSVRRRLFDFLKERVAGESDPYSVGDALTGVWKGFWRYRVGDYRVICRIEKAQVLVMVVRIGHRSEVYAAAPEIRIVKESGL